MEDNQAVLLSVVKNPLLEEGIQERFEEEILEMIRNDYSAIDAVIEWCEINEIEPEAVTDLIRGSIKDSIESEAVERHLLRGRNIGQSGLFG